MSEVQASANEHPSSSSCDDEDEYKKCERLEKELLLPRDPPVAISVNTETVENATSDAITNHSADDSPQPVLLAPDNFDPLNSDAGENLESIHEDDDDGDDVDEGSDDVREQQSDDVDTDVYQQTSEVSAADNVPDYMAARSLDDNNNSVEMSDASDPASGSSSSSGAGYWRAEILLHDAADSSSLPSGMNDSHSLDGNSDELAASADSPDSENGYCSVGYFTDAGDDDCAD